MVICPQCGTENEEAATFCVECGNVLNEETSPPPPSYSQSGPTAPLGSNAPTGPMMGTPTGSFMKDRSLALILEIIPGLITGFFGLPFIGVGWLYAGQTQTGVIMLVASIVWDIMAIILAAVTAGICCLVLIPLDIAAIAVSAVMLNNYTKQHPELFR